MGEKGTAGTPARLCFIREVWYRMQDLPAYHVERGYLGRSAFRMPRCATLQLHAEKDTDSRMLNRTMAAPGEEARTATFTNYHPDWIRAERLPPIVHARSRI